MPLDSFMHSLHFLLLIENISDSKCSKEMTKKLGLYTVYLFLEYVIFGSSQKGINGTDLVPCDVQCLLMSRPLHFIFLAKFVMNFKDKVGIIDKSTVESIGSPFKNISVIQQWIVLFAKYNHSYEIFLYLTNTF